VGQSGVQFDMDKLRWFNEHYLRSRSDASLAEEFQAILAEEGIRAELDYLVGVAAVMRDRISFPADILEARYFFEDPDSYDGQAVGKRWKEDSRSLVEEYARRIEALEPLDAGALEEALRELAEENGAGAGRIIHPVRLAVSGVAFGPGLFELLALIGRETTVRRLRRAAEVLA
jgi:glutamyl-tRNA synthetase